MKGLKTFGVLWTGQLVSLLGSVMTSFGLGIWILERSGSVSRFALVLVLASLPGLAVSPVAGALVDRWDRRRVMLSSDLGAALVSLAVYLTFRAGMLDLWHIYVAVGLNSIAASFQSPAYLASITLLVDKAQFGRVSGMLQFGPAGASIGGPALAGALMQGTGLGTILLIDLATFLFAAAALALVRVPRPAAAATAARGSLVADMRAGWVYLRERPGLTSLLCFFAAVNLVSSICATAVLPMVLAFGSPAAAGTVMSMVGVGLLAGSLVMTLTGGPKRLIRAVLGMPFVYAVAFVLVGLRPSVVLVSAGVVLWYVGLPIQSACGQAVWQRKIAPEIQGRIFAVRRVVGQFTIPVGNLSAGPLCDHVFGPWLMSGGLLAGSVGAVVGVGPGRGIGFLFLVASALSGLTALWGFSDPRLRQLEDAVPDADGTAGAPGEREACET